MCQGSDLKCSLATIAKKGGLRNELFITYMKHSINIYSYLIRNTCRRYLDEQYCTPTSNLFTSVLVQYYVGKGTGTSTSTVLDGIWL